MSIDIINEWHSRARPNPDDKAFNVQLGCHLEEIVEMLEAVTFCLEGHSPTPGHMTILYTGLKLFADKLKSGEVAAAVDNREEFLDSLADQIVTATGVGHCAKMNVPEAVRRVNASNWTKYVDGKPVFNQHGKITKPEGYQPPDLTGLY